MGLGHAARIGRVDFAKQVQAGVEVREGSGLIAALHGDLAEETVGLGQELPAGRSAFQENQLRQLQYFPGELD